MTFDHMAPQSPHNRLQGESLSTVRNGSIDVMRFVAALSIIWFHLPLPGGATALAALHVFVLLQVLFGASRPLGPQAIRLLVPWLAWSTFYAAASVVQASLQIRPVSTEFELWMILTGASLHLWYLPFSLGAVWIAGMAIRVMSRKMLIGVGTGIMLVCGYFSNETVLAIPWAQYVSVGPAVVLGIWLAAGMDPRCVVAAGLMAGLALMAGTGWSSAIWQSVLALVVVAVAFFVPMPSTAMTRWLGRISFGLYLVHPAIYAIFLTATDLPGSALFLAVTALSIVLSEGLRRVAPALI